MNGPHSLDESIKVFTALRALSSITILISRQLEGFCKLPAVF